MNIGIDDLSAHLNNSSEMDTLFNTAINVGFKSDPNFDEEHYLTNALNALKVAKINNLSEVDNFVTKNIGEIKEFFAALIKSNFRDWVLCRPFLFELITIAKEPSIFTKKYQEQNKWDEVVAGYVQSAIAAHPIKK